MGQPLAEAKSVSTTMRVGNELTVSPVLGTFQDIRSFHSCPMTVKPRQGLKFWHELDLVSVIRTCFLQRGTVTTRLFDFNASFQNQPTGICV